MKLFKVWKKSFPFNIQYWKGESAEWVLARLCDMFSLSDDEMREMSIEEISLEEAKNIIIPSYCCQRFDDTPLSTLFAERDNGVTCLAISEDCE